MLPFPFSLLESVGGHLGQILLLGAAVLVGAWALTQAGMLIDVVVGLVEWVITDVGGAVGQLVIDILAGIIEAVGKDVIGV